VAALSAMLAHAGVTLIDPHTGRSRPAAVSSGTGQHLTAAFDPSWLVGALPPPD
jgi:hypothetical protein